MSEPLAKLPIAALRAQAEFDNANFDVFLPNPSGSGPVLYHKSSLGIDSLDFDRIEETGVGFLLIRLEDFHRCEEALESRLSAILSSETLDPGSKAIITHSAGSAVARQLLDGPPDAKALERTVGVVDTMMNSLMHEPAIASHLLQMAGHERSTASHMLIVSSLAMALGAEIFGQGEQALIRCLGTAGMLHDIGKLSVPEHVLKKVTPLTRAELALLQQHPIESVRLVTNDPTVSPMARQMILQHHERIDGRGYPLGLSDDEILMATRVLSVVDAFHAMVGRRTYRESMDAEHANRILMTQAGKQFDVDVLRIWEELCENRRADFDGTDPVAVAFSDSGEDEIATRDEHKPAPTVPANLDRRPARHLCPGETSVRCVYAGRLAAGQEVPPEFPARVHDISRSGLCILTETPLYRGELINVRMAVAGEYVWIRSKVAWCRHEAEMEYKNGLQFVHKMPADESHVTATVERAQGLVDPAEKDAVAVQESTAEEAKPSPKTQGGRKRTAGKAAEKEQLAGDASASRDLKRLNSLVSTGIRNKVKQREIIGLVMSGDIESRTEGARVLGRINTTQSREALCVLLNDQNRAVRESAIMTCGAHGVRQSMDQLRTIMNGDDVKHALFAAESLSKLDDKSGLRMAASILRKNIRESRLAARVVGEITGHKFAANSEGIKAAIRYLKAKQLVGFS
ncbi:MAG: HD domain-containing phosphohydrolase [Phycisphaerae bacterium]